MVTAQAFIYISDPAALNDDRVMSRTLEILSDDELKRFERLRFNEDQRAFAASHGLVRQTLSRFAPVAPADWAFINRKDGRPELADKFSKFQLRFNLSHSRGLVACIITVAMDCGVDVERFSKVKVPLNLARRFFNEREYLHLLNLEGKELDRRFIEIWTLKEAYVKAKGLGIRLGLSNFWFDIDDDLGVLAHVDPTEKSRKNMWHFSVSHADKNHALGAAVANIKKQPVNFEIAQINL